MTSNSRYSMLDSMDIRCSRCGYENNPQFRFCGMCGGALRPRDPEMREEARPEAVPSPRQEPRKFSQSHEGTLITESLKEPLPPVMEPMPVEPLIAELTAAQKAQVAQASVVPVKSASVPVIPIQPSSGSNILSPPKPMVKDVPRESREEPYVPEPVHGERTPIPVTGPSFLGLSESSNEDRGFEYLLEDEPHPGRLRTLVGVMLLIAIAAGGFLFWRRAGYPWPSRSETRAASTPHANSDSEDTAPSAEKQTTENSPIGANQTSTKSPSDLTPKDDLTPSESVSKPVPENETQGSAPATAPSRSVAYPPSAMSKPSAVQAASLQPVAPRKFRNIRPAVTTSTAPNPAEDSLFLQGQKYLYGGGGVPANCPKALQYLVSSANDNNSKAQSTLGTMYATGHCVRRDIPLAYRWFARALRADPRNTRLEQDVSIMWNQMSPQERNAALKTE